MTLWNTPKSDDLEWVSFVTECLATGSLATLNESLAGLRFTPAGPGVPRWLHTCRHLRNLLTGEDVRPAWAEGALQCLASLEACQDRNLLSGLSEATASITTPARVAALAGGFAVEAPDEAALGAWLRDDWPDAPVLTMHVLLVDETRNKCCRALLDLWVVPGSIIPRRTEQSPGLVRAPSIALLGTDEAFDCGIKRLQRLLGHLTVASAPTVAFGLRSNDDPLMEITGDSATAALTVGALWLLQHSLRPQHDALAAALRELRPERLLITGGLSEVPNSPEELQARWPQFTAIGSYCVKVAGARPLVQAHPELRTYEVQEQPPVGAGVIDRKHYAALARTLPDDFECIASKTGHGLNSAQRVLYRRVLDGFLADIAPADWQPAKPRPRLQTSLEAWLLHRCALRAGLPAGTDPASPRSPWQLPFDPPAALAHRFSPIRLVRLVAGCEREHLALQQLLHASDSTDPAWCLVGPPLSGKSTLLAWWEMDSAARALKRLNLGPLPDSTGHETHWKDAVEVCLYVNLRALTFGENVAPGDTGVVLCQYLRDLAPWLQVDNDRISAPDAGAPAFGSAGYRRRRVSLRLLFDGADGLSAPSEVARLQRLRDLAQWLARQQAGTFLPPVFTTRNEADVNALHTEAAGTPWRPAGARLLPWDRADWREHLGKPDATGTAALAGPALKVLYHELGLNFPPETDASAPYDAFQAFCQLPGNLAGVCNLLGNDATAGLPNRSGQLLLALLLQRLAKDAIDPATPILSRDRLPVPVEALHSAGLGSDSIRSLMTQPFIMALASLAATMTDGARLPTSMCLCRHAPTGWNDPQSSNLIEARRLGLVAEAGGELRFTHPQWQALFLAMARNLGLAELPGLEPPPVEQSQSGLASIPSLARLAARPSLRLPLRTAQHEAIRLMVDLADDPARWIARVMQENLALAAQLAIDRRTDLQADISTSGLSVLDDLRNALLNSSKATNEPLARRMDAALLLGQLGDTLRFEAIHTPCGSRVLRRLKSPHWHLVKVEGQVLHVAALLLTQGEWDDFIADLRCRNTDPGNGITWAWQQLRAAQGSTASLHGMGLHLRHPLRANPTLPVTGVSLMAVRAYLAWARQVRLYADFELGDPDLPTEWEWFQAALQCGKAAPPTISSRAPGVPDANHGDLGWNQPSPVGLFAAGTIAAQGGVLADLRGNVRQWCGSALDSFGLAKRGSFNAINSNQPIFADLNGMAVRGTSFDTSANRCRIEERSCAMPDRHEADIGVRLVLRRALAV